MLEKEVKQLSSLEPHDRIVTYLGTCYAKHPCSNAMSLYVFTEFMPGVSLTPLYYVLPATVVSHNDCVGISLFFSCKEGPTFRKDHVAIYTSDFGGSGLFAQVWDYTP